MSLTRVAAAQIDCLIGQPEKNRSKIVSAIRSAAEQDTRLIAFPECALTGYCFESRDEAAPFAETADGRSAEVIAEACRKTEVFAVVGFIERDGRDYFNSAMLVGPEGLIGCYRKVHLPLLGIDRFLMPGNRAFQIYDLPFGNVGINICYDISFPEATRSLKLLGADLILLPTNWPPGASRNPRFVVQTRAHENHVNFLAANRVGTERGWEFIGQSRIVDFNGDIVAGSEGDREEVLYADLDLNAARNNRVVNVPGTYEIDRIADRRPEFYGSLVLPRD